MRPTVELCARRAPWIFVLCWWICNPLDAIDRDRRLDQLHHDAWTAKDGAPTYTRAWAQTPDGFLWFCTVSTAPDSSATMLFQAWPCRN